MNARSRAYRDLGGLARIARMLLYTQALAAAAAVASALSYGAGFDDENGSPLYLVVALLQMLAYFVSGVAVLRWIYLANANVHAFGAQGVGGPGLAVAWYFIPIACLFMPFQSMREIWKASRSPGDWEIVEAPATIGWWWLFWLAASIAGVAAFRLADERVLDGATRVGEILTTASDALMIPASLLLAMIVAEVTALQHSRLGDPAGSPAAIAFGSGPSTS